MHKPFSLVGSRIISDDGHLLGKVERFYLEREGGRISRLDIAGGPLSGLWSGHTSVPASYIITIGAEAVVVDRACLEDLQVTASVLQVNFAAAKERAAGLWQQTVDGTQRLRRGVLQHINEMRQEAHRQRKTVEELPEELDNLRLESV